MGFKSAAAVIIITATLGLLGIVGAVIFLSDCEPPNDAHLVYQYEKIPPADNGLDLFLETETYIAPDVELIDKLETEQWNSTKAAALIQRQKAATELWEKGMKRPKLQVPEIQDLADSVSYLGNFRSVARLQSIRSRLLAEKGKTSEALALCVRISEFGVRQQSSSGALMNCLLGGATRGIALSRIRQIIMTHEVSTQDLKRTEKKLERMPNSLPPLKEALKIEYGLFKKLILTSNSDRANTSKPGQWLKGQRNPLVFKEHKTAKRLLEVMEKHISNCDRNIHNREISEARKKLSFKLVLKGNAMGEILCGMLTVHGKALTKADMHNTDHQITRIQLALTGYRNDHNGKFPSSLNALMPAYINEIPMDPFSKNEESIKYSVEKKILYTVGQDGIDDGGPSIETIKERLQGNFEQWRWKANNPCFPLVNEY